MELGAGLHAEIKIFSYFWLVKFHMYILYLHGNMG